jgi:cyclic-di-GMP phosphodiesterase TipF (flagellum assembly factor)
MRKITGGLIVFGCLFLALSIGAMIWRAGMGAGAGVAGTLGAGGIMAALFALVQGALERHALRMEISKVREAHRLLADAMESTQGALTELAQAIENSAFNKTDALTGEVRMLEGLIHQMSESIDERLTLPANGNEVPTENESAPHSLLQVIEDALGHNRADLYLQPVVSLPQRRTHYYEAYTRLRDASGRILLPSEYLSVAEDQGLVSAIDNLLLIRCAQIVRRLHRSDRKVGIFCNISFDTLGDEDFFPQFLEFLGQNRDLSESLIFEVGQAAFEARGATEARNMAKLADLGFRFSIDKVQTLDLDFTDLQRSDVRFIKVAADLLIEQLLEMDGAVPLPSQPDIQAADFAPLTRRHGLELIAEKVETEKQVVDILELDISVGQGHLFGEPRAIKEAVLAETDPPAGFVQAQARRF